MIMLKDLRTEGLFVLTWYNSVMSKTNKIQNKSSRRAVFFLISGFYFSSLATHVLIISKILPYQWVSGGMSPSYEVQAVQSAVNIVVISLLFLLMWKITNLKTNPKVWQRRTLYIVTALWIIGFIMQLLGTSFERYVMSVVLLVGVAGHIQLVRGLPRL
jgi:hypothetical protein